MDELLRMKRKEKHMAPIDCSGVSAAFNMRWKCKLCDRQHSSKSECDFYRHYHNPRHFVLNNPQTLLQLPNELEMRMDGVYTAKSGLKPYTRLGPLKGQVSDFCRFWEVADLKRTCFAQPKIVERVQRPTWAALAEQI